jgi:hypothetical protein
MANDDDSRYCDRCGAVLSGASATPSSPVAGAAPTSPTVPANPGSRLADRVVYAPARRHAWWFPIGVWAVLSAFFLFTDTMTTRSVSWSVWPVGVIGIFLVGLPLLRRLEAWSFAHGKKPRS